MIGLGLATFGLLEARSDSRTLSPETAAQVGERMIRRVDYERVLAGVEKDLRNPIDEKVRRLVLDRMVDEELLVQRALELGLAGIDRRVRGELTAGLMDSIVGDADGVVATDEEVVRHFEANLDFFTRPGRLRAEVIHFSSRHDGDGEADLAAERAARAASQLRAGDTPADIESQLGDRQMSPLPNAMLPGNKIRDYVGPTVLQTLVGLEIGVWSDPIASGGGFYVARVLDREANEIPVFEDVQELVRQDLRRRRGDEALQRYLEDLRTRISVAINPAVFSDPR